jgi:hypothetical protein
VAAILTDQGTRTFTLRRLPPTTGVSEPGVVFDPIEITTRSGYSVLRLPFVDAPRERTGNVVRRPLVWLAHYVCAAAVDSTSNAEDERE